MSLSSSAEVAAGTARRWERREEERAVEEQPEAALTKSSGGEERRLATSSTTESLARKETALDQDEGRNGPRRGVCMCVYVCMYVRHPQKIAKLFFSVQSTQFPFKLNILFKKQYINLLGLKTLLLLEKR